MSEREDQAAEDVAAANEEISREGERGEAAGHEDESEVSQANRAISRRRDTGDGDDFTADAAVLNPPD